MCRDSMLEVEEGNQEVSNLLVHCTKPQLPHLSNGDEDNAVIIQSYHSFIFDAFIEHPLYVERCYTDMAPALMTFKEIKLGIIELCLKQ